MADGLKGAAHRLRGSGIERISLRLDGTAAAREGPAGEALRDEALHPDRAARREQVIGPSSSALVSASERSK